MGIYLHFQPQRIDNYSTFRNTPFNKKNYTHIARAVPKGFMTQKEARAIKPLILNAKKLQNKIKQKKDIKKLTKNLNIRILGLNTKSSYYDTL